MHTLHAQGETTGAVNPMYMVMANADGLFLPCRVLRARLLSRERRCNFYIARLLHVLSVDMKSVRNGIGGVAITGPL